MVDASGMGADKGPAFSNISNEPKWKELNVSFHNVHKQVGLFERNVSVTPRATQHLEVSVYLPSTRQSSRLTSITEISDLLDRVKSKAPTRFPTDHSYSSQAGGYWHFLIGGSKNLPKLMIRDLILKDKKYDASRSTHGSVLEKPKDLAAILTSLEARSIFELDGLEELFTPNCHTGDLLYQVLPDFQLDIIVGEGKDSRYLKLDIQPFFSIFYCKEIDKVPFNLLNLFDCCFTLDE